jgi:hypothetical protein
LTNDGISAMLTEDNKNGEKTGKNPVKRFQKSYKSYKNQERCEESG